MQRTNTHQRQVQRHRSEAKDTNSEAVGVNRNGMLGRWHMDKHIAKQLLFNGRKITPSQTI